MDRDEVRYHEAATKQGMFLWRNDDATWSVSARSDELPQPGRPVVASESWLSDGTMRLANGRVFMLRKTTDEFREALGLDA
jgi:hypothetical protein